MEESYKSFARVYDMFMDNIDYPAWRDYLLTILEKNNINEGLILELGCGTGSMTELLAEAGYDMIGIDNSEDMLEMALEKRVESGHDDILYLQQDMREFELYGTVRAVISVCDSINYILEEEELLEVFRLVNNYLDPGGIFIFDMNTPYKYENLMGDSTIAENREEGSFIWENYFDEETQVNEYALTLFIREKDELYRRYEEYHYQKAYDMNTVMELLERSGLELVAVYDAFSTEEPRVDSERICFVARECRKGHKDGTKTNRMDD
ncbi:MAG: class I SAM-dependent methyltransferase [Clostridia bacterium]|nr:class I SAM-dependent methyltransferase [Clostridia bacterium]NCC42418.1 class I SAM-dependent methyltransferase [Clostridia bacterium]